MTDPDFETVLASSLAEYRALQRLCGNTLGNSVLGQTLDAGAGTLAIHLASVTDEAQLTEGLQEWLFEIPGPSYGNGRDSLALAPVLALIDAMAPGEEIATALMDGATARPDQELGPALSLAQAMTEMKMLLGVTGNGGVWGDVFYAARTTGQDYLEDVRRESRPFL